jgi:hypothetical protein
MDKSYALEVIGDLKEKSEAISMRITSGAKLSKFDLKVMRLAIDELEEYNEHLSMKEFAESIKTPFGIE